MTSEHYPVVCPFCLAEPADHALCSPLYFGTCECFCGIGLDLPWIPKPREGT